MEVNVREKNEVTIFDIQGTISTDAQLLHNQLQEHITSKAEHEVKVLLNLAKVPMMDISGLGVVVAT